MNNNTSTKNIRILIVDDHPIFRGGLKTLLSNIAGFDILGEAANGSEAIVKASELKPDVILMDLIMPEKDGIQASREILKENPETHILVLSSFGDDSKIMNAIKTGVTGYILKETPPEQLISAIKQVHEGRPFIQPTVMSRLMHLLNKNAEPVPSAEQLTEREQDVLKLVAIGATNQEIALTLNITENTVIKHISNILNKLNLENRTQAALYAVRQGLVPLYPD